MPEKKALLPVILPLILIYACVLTVVIRIGCGNVMQYDGLGYYMYLPQAFIYNDLEMKNLDTIEKRAYKYESNRVVLYQFNHHKNGNNSIKYPVGLALMQTPFFLCGHAYAKLSNNYDADGFSNPYRFVMIAGHVFYIFLGTFLLLLSLRRYFPPWIAAISTVCIAVCTNLFIQATHGVMMTHGPLFCVEMAVLFLTINVHDKPAKKTFFLLGFALAMAAVTRPLEILLVIIPLLWNINSVQSLRNKIKWLKINLKGVFISLAGFALPISIQMAYWYYATGSPVFYSYINVGEGFDFLSSHIISNLFHPNSGVFLYNPLLILSLFGLFFFYKSTNRNFLAIKLFLVVFFYFTSTWSTWQIGFRSFSQSFGFFGFGIALILENVFLHRNIFAKTAVGIFTALLMYISVLFHYQYFQSIIHPNNMTMAYFWRIFGRFSIEQKDKELLGFDRDHPPEIPSEKEYAPNKFLVSGDFKYSAAGDIAHNMGHNDSVSVMTYEDRMYAEIYRSRFKDICSQDHCYIKVSFWYYLTVPVDTAKPSIVVELVNDEGCYSYCCKLLESEQPGQKQNCWNFYEFWYLPFPLRYENDNLHVFFWSRGKGKVYFDDVFITEFEKK